MTNFSDDIFNILINVHQVKSCGCLIDDIERQKCLNKYEVENAKND